MIIDTKKVITVWIYLDLPTWLYCDKKSCDIENLCHVQNASKNSKPEKHMRRCNLAASYLLKIS